MKRTALLIGLFIITGMLLSGQRTSRIIEGAWSGKLKTASVELQIVFRFTITEADSIKAVLDSPDQGAFDIPRGSHISGKTHLFVDIPIVQGSYRGGFGDEALISGTFAQMGIKYKLSITKGAKPVVYNRPQEAPMPPYP